MKQPIYWTFETKEGELLVGWCEETEAKLLELATWEIVDLKKDGWKPVKVQLTKVSK